MTVGKTVRESEQGMVAGEELLGVAVRGCVAEAVHCCTYEGNERPAVGKEMH